jgi:hypothetical protein
MRGIATAWRILYGEAYESIPDPNQPENTAHLNALKNAEKDALERFLNGQGKVLVDRWTDKIKQGIVMMIASESEDCSCATCTRLRGIKSLFEMLMEAQEVLTENQGEKNV